ncbi:MAG: DNA recombination protein RmuC [Rhodospirillales bacterium]|nr:DNA recombination protein RmuC [Rhodospirillales bacterium]
MAPVGIGVVVFLVFILWLRAERRRAKAASRISDLSEIAEKLMATQNELGGRLQQTQTGLNERLDGLNKRLGDSFAEQTEKTGETLKDLHSRLAVIDRAQQKITDLSQQVVGLQDILSNKQARGAFGEIQLQDIVVGALPPSAYDFQVTLGNGSRVDCLLKLPNPPGSIALDAKFPLESYRALRNAADDAEKVQASRAFSADVIRHVKAISEKYVIPGETAESALMFLPSEAVYAELHANFGNVIEESYRRRVWIVSPTTLMATLNTVRAVLKDARMREQAGVIQTEVLTLLDDVERLDKRVGRLNQHFDQTAEDIRQIRISTDKVIKRAERIDEIQLGEETPAADLAAGDLPPPAQSLENN